MIDGIFDSHAHYDDRKFDDDRESSLKSIFSSGVIGILNCGSDIDSSKYSVELSRSFEKMYVAVGVHPHSAEDDISRLDELLPLLKEEKVVAVGEIGLDYHYDFSPRDLQKEIFEKQLIIANEHNLPVIIHDREAHEDTLNLLKKYKPIGVVHCFSGSVEMAKEVIKLGMYIGLGGAVTFKNAVKPVEVAEYVPLDRLLLETDCPYMAPVPLRGKRCDSTMIEYTARRIAEIKNIEVNELVSTASSNTKTLFKI